MGKIKAIKRNPLFYNLVPIVTILLIAKFLQQFVEMAKRELWPPGDIF
jgi:hypothetical protein